MLQTDLVTFLLMVQFFDLHQLNNFWMECFMSHKILSCAVPAALAAFLGADLVPTAAFGMGVDPVPTLTFPPRPSQEKPGDKCRADATAC